MLQAIARAEAIADTVFFLGFRQDVPDILSAAHGCILTSHSEALPMSLLEAGAQGLCLVSSDVGGVRDIIEPERSGYIFPKSDYDALAAVLQRAVEDPDTSAALGRAAQQHILQQYSLEVVLAAFDALYSKR
jgi:glycosyltransferase involved in cell wall biosynthesis